METNKTSVSEKDRRAKFINLNSEDIPEITKFKIRTAIKHMTNGTSASKDKILLIIKQGRTIRERQVKILFKKCRVKVDIPQDWRKALLIVIHKIYKFFSLAYGTSRCMR